MQLALIVIRCKDLETSRIFYEQLGLTLIAEKHGTGPKHYSTKLGQTVLELYPSAAGQGKDNVRLGFKLANIQNILNHIEVVDSYQRGHQTVYITQDPDGRKVELYA